MNSVSLGNQTQLDSCNVFIKYLPCDMTEADFYQLFKEFGEIVSSKIMFDQITHKSLGYGYKLPNEAKESINKMNGHKIGAKRLLCKLANVGSGDNNSVLSNYPNNGISKKNKYNFFPNSAPDDLAMTSNSPRMKNPNLQKHSILSVQAPSNNIYIKPLLAQDNEETLREVFGKFGKIIECKVMVDKTTGLSKQIGFVRYGKVEEAANAIQAMNRKQREPGAPPLSVKYADNENQKEVRKALRQNNGTTINHGPYNGTPYYWSSFSMWYPWMYYDQASPPQQYVPAVFDQSLSQSQIQPMPPPYMYFNPQNHPFPNYPERVNPEIFSSNKLRIDNKFYAGKYLMTLETN